MAWILPTMANTRISIWHQMGRKLLGISVSLSLSLCLSISVFLSHTHAHTYTHSCSENSSVVDRNTEHSRTGSPTLRRSRKTAQLLHEKSTPTANKQPLQSAVDSASIIWHLVRGTWQPGSRDSGGSHTSFWLCSSLWTRRQGNDNLDSGKRWQELAVL